MKRTKFTDFVLKYLKWTSSFLYEPIYLSRATKVLSDIKNNLDEIERISQENNDVVKGFSKEKNSNNETVYRIDFRI